MINKILAIPQNEKKNFIIVVNIYNNSIEVMFDPNESINKENLFLILKWYVKNNNEIMNFSLIGNNSVEEQQNKFTNVLKNIKTKVIDKMTFFDFNIWFGEIANEDWKYINNFKYFGIQIRFIKEVYDLKKNIPLPEYPWNEEFKKNFIQDDVIKNLEKELEKEKELNKMLLKKLEEIKKKK